MPAATPPPSPDRAPRRTDALSTLASLLFITWCFVIGTLLLYAPWMPVWARVATSFSDPTLQELLAHPTVRGAICGFGLFHLVYGTHDLDAVIAQFLRRRQARVEASAAGGGGTNGDQAAADLGDDSGGLEGGKAAEAGPERPVGIPRGEP